MRKGEGVRLPHEAPQIFQFSTIEHKALVGPHILVIKYNFKITNVTKVTHLSN
jgi:hypothetical protein